MRSLLEIGILCGIEYKQVLQTVCGKLARKCGLRLLEAAETQLMLAELPQGSPNGEGPSWIQLSRFCPRVLSIALSPPHSLSLQALVSGSLMTDGLIPASQATGTVLT